MSSGIILQKIFLEVKIMVSQAQTFSFGRQQLDDFTPLPNVEDMFDSQFVDLCKRIGRKLKAATFTVDDVKHIWRRSRQNRESLGIISDLTGLTIPEVCYVLNVSSDKCTEDTENISEYWAGVSSFRGGHA